MSRIYDSQKVKELFDKELELLKEQHPEIDIDKISISLSEQIDEHFKYIRVGNNTRQRVIYNVAGMLLETDERKLWWLYETIMQLIPEPEIETILKERYGKNYLTLIKRLFNIKNKVNKIKYILDMKDKVSSNSKEFWILHKQYLGEVDKIELIEYELFDVLIAITESSNIGTYSIPDSIINTMQKQIKKPEYKDERREEQQERKDVRI